MYETKVANHLTDNLLYSTFEAVAEGHFEMKSGIPVADYWKRHRD
jgi:hypothetical protein